MPLLLLLACDPEPTSDSTATGSTADDCAALSLWAPDEDGDGYGDETATWLGCEPPEGWVAVAGDCDDGDALVHEGAPDACGDTVDADCDGVVLDAPEGRELASDRAAWVATSGEVDGYGSTLLGLDTLFVVGAPAAYENQGPEGTPGSVYLQTAQGGVRLFASAGQPGDAFGYALAAADLDGDTVVDLAVSSADGVYAFDLGGDRVGSVSGEGVGFAFTPDPTGGLVVAGTSRFARLPTVIGPVDLDGTEAWELPDGAISRVEDAHDVDGDGVDELALVAYHLVGTEVTGVTLGLYPFGAPWDVPRLEVGGPPEALRMDLAAVGDVTGDGYADLALADGYWDDGELAAVGRVWLVSGPDPDPSVPAAVLTGATRYDTLGASVAAGPDWSGDGLPELVVGGPYADNTRDDYAGEVWIYACGPAGALGPADADWVLHGSAYFTNFGAATAVAPDLDEDGLAELLVGQPAEFVGEPGAVFTFLSSDLVR